jgi:oligoendopeptidase F
MMGKDIQDDGSLPRWDLRDFYASETSVEFLKALDAVERDAVLFSQQYSGKVAKLPGKDLGEAIAAFEALSENMGRIQSYASLSRVVDQEKDAWAEGVYDRLRKASEKLLFFTIEINQIKEIDLLSRIAASELAKYAPWVGRVRSFREHQLDAAEEAYIHQKAPVAQSAWTRLFDQTLMDLRFNFDGREMTKEQILNVIHTSPDKEKRHQAYAEFNRVLGEHKKTFSLITNTLADLKAKADEWRGFENPEDSRHLANRIDGETVEAMTTAVRDSYARTAHRYYEWKAKKFGVTRLHPADRNAPLPGDAGKKIPWEEAKTIILDAYARVSPEMAAIAREFFDKGWIDAEPRAGKRGGAFAHSTVPSAHPCIMVNYFGSPRDVQVLAHELGHGVHQVLASRQGYFNASTPLTLAETASVFGEMMVFRALLDREEDMIARRAMISAKIEDMMNTVVRQTAFYTFEQRVHGERREKGELTPERISKIWTETQSQSLGSSINMDVPGAENGWTYIPHFINSPFYVYAYAFGDCLVNALYDEYQKTPDKTGFEKKYLDLLKAGGTKPHAEALAPFGFDTNDPAFWKKGLSVIERYIDELIVLDRKIEAVQKSTKDFKNTAQDMIDPPRPENDNQQFARPKPPKPGDAA